jgi:uncharacterized OB-fold protein
VTGLQPRGIMVTAFPGHNAVDHQIIEDLGHGPVLVASECPRCGLVRYPPRELCPDDLTVMRTIPLSGPGTLHQAVRVDLAPVGFVAPYWIAHIDLPEGVRVYAPLSWDGDGDPPTGLEVTYSLGIVRTEPEEILGPIFRPLGLAAG